MATASYTTDLSDITLAETTTGWTALGGGASGLDQNADSSMQGTYGVGKQISGAEKGQVYGSGGTTIGSGRHVYTWLFMTTPGLTDTLALRGLTVAIGSSTSAYCKYHVEGNDTYGAAGRVGKCYPVDPSVYTSNTGSSPYRTVVGSPSGTYAEFGGLANITATVKGFNLVVDAIRHGTGVYVTGGDGADPDAAFAGLATQNDAVANRWGVFTAVGGGYELQGKLAIGQNNSGTATVCVFTDSNKSVAIPENPHVASTFNQIIVDHASSVLTLTNVTFSSLGTTSPGTFTVTSNNPTVDLTGCNFLNMGAFTLRSNTTATGCAWRGGTASLAVNGATLDSCVFANFTAATTLTGATTDLANITDCSFVSDGSNYGIDIGTVSSSTSVNWNNFLTGYQAGSTGSPVSTTTTGNEAIRVNVASGQTLTINVGSGYGIPSVRNDGTGSVNVVAGQVTTTITATTQAGTPIQNARVYLIAESGGPLTAGTVIFNDLTDINGEVSDIRSLASAQPVSGWIRKGTSAPYYKTSQITATIDNSTGLDLTVLMIPDE